MTERHGKTKKEIKRGKDGDRERRWREKVGVVN